MFEIQDLKMSNAKRSTETKTKRFQYDLEQKRKFASLSEVFRDQLQLLFDFSLYPRSKTRKSRQFLFYFKF